MSPKDERYTPSAAFGPLDVEFRFGLDACATAESAKCARFFTREQDGLAQSWARERVWCNPPYSDIRPWVKKAWGADADVVVMLLPAWTDREWWGELVEPFRDRPAALESPRPHLSTRFISSRIYFGTPGDPEGLESGRPEFGSVLLIWEHP